eukprot:GDKI01030857.1.p1 GENE.GDKI01030857.1~~GDKI01030857.1.p1  ORF type:complete len:149 (-),score=30.39 GDKI01030857.1:200-646(-)
MSEFSPFSDVQALFSEQPAGSTGNVDVRKAAPVKILRLNSRVDADLESIKRIIEENRERKGRQQLELKELEQAISILEKSYTGKRQAIFEKTQRLKDATDKYSRLVDRIQQSNVLARETIVAILRSCCGTTGILPEQLLLTKSTKPQV